MIARSTFRAVALAAVLAPLAAGCGTETTLATSPVVSPDSPEAQKARADDEANRALLKQQEAKAAGRRHAPKLPAEG